MLTCVTFGGQKKASVARVMCSCELFDRGAENRLQSLGKVASTLNH